METAFMTSSEVIIKINLVKDTVQVLAKNRIIPSSTSFLVLMSPSSSGLPVRFLCFCWQKRTITGWHLRKRRIFCRRGRLLCSFLLSMTCSPPSSPAHSCPSPVYTPCLSHLRLYFPGALFSWFRASLPLRIPSHPPSLHLHSKLSASLNFLHFHCFSICLSFMWVFTLCQCCIPPHYFLVSVSHPQLFSQLLFSSLHHLQSHCKPDPDFWLSPTALKSSSAIPFYCPGHHFEFLLHLSLLLSACPATETGFQHSSGPPGFLSFSVHSDYFLVYASWA